MPSLSLALDGPVSIVTNGSSYPEASGTSEPSAERQLPPSSNIRQKFLASQSDLALTLVGFSGGQGKAGVDTAPTALLSGGLLDQLSHELGYTLHGDRQVRNYNKKMPRRAEVEGKGEGEHEVETTAEGKDEAVEQDPPHRKMKNPRTVSAVTREIADQVYEQSRQGRMVLTLGGDHSIAIGTVAGVSRAIRERYRHRQEIAVIWVDAHADINTPETSDSGNVHGMPVAFLTGLARSDREDIFGWIQDDHRLSVSKLVYIALRDLDGGEKKIIRDHKIKAFTMRDVDKYGIGSVVDMALAHIGSDTPIHLSFDVDALDPMWAPSTGTPVRGGLTLREGDFIAESVHETGQLVAMDLVEVNPSLEIAGASETVRAGISLIRCALGDTLL